MAADLGTLKVSIDGSSAVSQAQQISQELTKMGTAGDEAAAKVAASAQKMSVPMREATQTAQAAQSIFGRLQMSMGQPVSQQAALTAMMELQRAMVTLLQVQRDAEAAGKTMGGSMGAAFKDVAVEATKAAASMEGIAAQIKEMAAAGAGPEEVMTVLASKVNAVIAAFERLGASQKTAFGGVSESAMATTAGFVPTETLAFSTAQTKATAETRATTEAIRNQGAEMDKAAGHASRLGSALAIGERGVHDLLTPFGLAAGPANMVGKLARGIDDLILSVARGGPAMLSFAGGMIAFSVAMKAIQAPIDFLKAAFSAGLGQEKLDIQMTGMLGSLGAAHDELEQIKAFVTGGSAGFLSFDDAQKGVERLQMLTGGIMSVSQALQILAGAQAASGQNAERLGEEIGKLSNYMLAGNPIRYAMLEGLVNLKVITAANAVELENLSKKGTSATAIFGQFETMLDRNAALAREASESFGGLWNRLQQITQTRVLEPIGEALTKGLAPALNELDQMFNSPALKTGISTFARYLEVQLIAAYLFIKEVGFVPAFKAGVDELGQYIKDSAPGWFESLRTGLNQALGQMFMARLVGDWKQAWDLFVGQIKLGQTFQPSTPVFPTTFTTATSTGTPLTQAQIDASKAQSTLSLKTTQLSDATVNLTEAMKKSQAEAEKMVAAQEAANAGPELVGGGGGLGRIDKSAQEQKAALRAIDDELKQLDTDWNLYGKTVTMVNDREKEGIVSTTLANKQKLELDYLLAAEIDTTIQKLEQQIQDAKKAYPDADVTNLIDKLKIYHERLDQIHEDEVKLKGTDPWTGMVRGMQLVADKSANLGEQMKQLTVQIGDEMARGIGEAMTQLETQTGKVGDAFKNMLTSMLSAINNFLAQQAVSYLFGMLKSLLQNLASSAGGAGAYPTGATGGAFQAGGLIVGPSGTDVVPSMLTAGEFVLSSKAVDRYGLAVIDAMNRGTARRFASGGFVGSATSPYNIPPSQNVGGATSVQTVGIVTNITVNAGGTSPSPAAVGGAGGQGGLSTQQISQFQQTLSLVVRDEIIRQKRPGGLLSKQQLTG